MRRRCLWLIIPGAIVAILAIVAIAGLCTNWFGFYGPATRIAMATKNTLESGNFTVKVRDKKTEGIVAVDVDINQRHLSMLFTCDIEGASRNYTNIIAIYHGHLITGFKWDNGSNYTKRDISKQLDDFFDLYEDTQELDWENILTTIDQYTDCSLKDQMDLGSLQQCAISYLRMLNSNKWLEENADYHCTKSNGTAYYSFTPNLGHFSQASLEHFETAFKEAGDYEKTKDDLSKSPLSNMNAKILIGIKDHRLSQLEIALDGEKQILDLQFQFTDFGSTTVDETELAAMLDNAKLAK